MHTDKRRQQGSNTQPAVQLSSRSYVVFLCLSMSSVFSAVCSRAPNDYGIARVGLLDVARVKSHDTDQNGDENPTRLPASGSSILLNSAMSSRLTPKTESSGRYGQSGVKM